MGSLESLKTITAIIDAQGYYINKKFYPVELSVVGEDVFYCYPIDSGLELEKLSSKDKKNALFVTNAIHGLSFCPPGSDVLCKYKAKDIMSLLTVIYYNLREKHENVVFGCKNVLLARILDRSSFDYVDLCDRKHFAPTLQQLDKAQQGEPWFCAFHTNLPQSPDQRRNFRCSVRKCSLLWKWLCQRVKDLTHQKEVDDKQDAAWDAQEPQKPDPMTYKWAFLHHRTADGPIFHRPYDKEFSTYEACLHDYKEYRSEGFDVCGWKPTELIIFIEIKDN
jgi:hypothetical protein